VTRSQGDARFARMRSCYWKYSPCSTAQGCVATCDAGGFAISGGCDAAYGAGNAIIESFPGPSKGYGSDGNSGGPWYVGAAAGLTQVDSWTCSVEPGKTINNVYVFCCPAI
jgi:hypothetical protein